MFILITRMHDISPLINVIIIRKLTSSSVLFVSVEQVRINPTYIIQKNILIFYSIISSVYFHLNFTSVALANKTSRLSFAENVGVGAHT